MNSQFLDEDEENSWVIVKKQKINILITPPSPQSSQLAIRSQDDAANNGTDDCSCVETSLPIVDTQLGIRWVCFLNFKQRIEEVGGVKTWLVSNGFERFVPVFEREKLSVDQLFVISMESLKEMGVVPVGPRRKLVHAVEKLSQPL